MTGICGMIASGSEHANAADLSTSLHALRFFSDGSRARTWEDAVGSLSVAFGAHAPAPSRPLLSADGGLTLVADVVLDCRGELIAALGPRVSSASSDEELVLAAYERWGEACVERLSGEFAFALADDRRGGVLLARDQLGCRPLVLHERPGRVCFATTALALADLPGVGHHLDEQRVAEWLAFVMNSDATFVRGASLLSQGHAVWIDAHGARRRRYWTLDPEKIVDLGSPEAHALALRGALDSAVARRLPRDDDGGVGVLLSGGLDSTSVAATAARLRAPGPVRTYTSVPPADWSGPTAPNFDASEQPVILDLASWHPNLQPTFVDRHEGSIFGRHDAAFRAGSPPTRNPCNALWHSTIVARAAEDGVQTLLTGARGNAFYSADDPRWLYDLFRRGRLAALRRELAATSAVAGQPQTALARSLILKELVPAQVLRWRRERRGAPARDPYVELASRSAGRDAEAVIRVHFNGDLEQSGLSRHQAVRAVMSQGGGAAESLAVVQALTGVRIADPTGDVRLIELCATQPSWYRRRDGRTRAVCRDAMADRVPASIAERTRRGAQLPDWLDRITAARGELAAELAAARESEACRNLLDLDRIDAALKDWPDRARYVAQQRSTNGTYRTAVLRGLMMAHYLRFFEDHARERRIHSRATLETTVR